MTLIECYNNIKIKLYCYIIIAHLITCRCLACANASEVCPLVQCPGSFGRGRPRGVSWANSVDNFPTI